MIDIGEEDKIKDSSNTSILIIDDVFTTGSTLNMVLNKLTELNFQGDISILTLISNT